MTSSTLEADPTSAGPASWGMPAPEKRRLRAERRAFHEIPRATWDRLAARVLAIAETGLRRCAHAPR